MSEKMQAGCHCGTVRFSVALADGFNTLRRCNCSFCRMRGATMVIAAPQGIDILAGKEALTEYRFHTRAAAHYFCSLCGIYTFHSRRSSPGQFVVNVACIDGVSPYDFESVDVSDGENHPGDGRSGGMAGTLVYRKKHPDTVRD